MTNLECLKSYIRKTIEDRFEINDCGCYTRNGQWLSSERIFDIVCDALDTNRFMLKEEPKVKEYGFRVHRIYTVYVEAASREEAEDLAVEKVCEGSLCTDDTYCEEITW